LFIHCLGAAAGGGFPQWNCACRQCRRARSQAGSGSPHASVAVSGTGERWFLINATPDVRQQIASDQRLHPGPGVRDTPLAGVLLTDAEFDHTIGLLILREGSELTVYGTPAVLSALTDHFPVRRLLTDYAGLRWEEIAPGQPVRLDERLLVTPFVVGGKRPRYVAGAAPASGWVVCFRLADPVSGAVAVYAPVLPSWSAALARALESADCVLVDGTFWTDDEMLRTGTGQRLASQMGHLPVSGPAGSAAQLAKLRARWKVYTHVNNTNPVLDPASPQHRYLAELGIEVAAAGWEAEL
jgi:pyrroloquinoline quinone biosynthesis protein B